MAAAYVLSGIELRYALTLYLAQHGPHTVAELVDALRYQGFDFRGKPSKVVSDALRWEIGHDRVVRIGWGQYGPGDIPRSTEYRIVNRVLTLRQARRVDPFHLPGWDGPIWASD